MANRPNILFITSDQQRGDCFGFEGRAVKTPHLNLLASQGTHFSSCITPNVVCQPSRASILTGLLPRTHGVHDNGIDLDPNLGEKGFAGALSRSGYDTRFIGKAHFSTYFTDNPTGTPECITSSANYGDDWHGPWMGFDQLELMLVGHNWFLPKKPPQGQHYEKWFYDSGYGDQKNLMYEKHLAPETHTVQTWHSGLPTAWHNSTWVGDRTIESLRENRDKPFCIWASFPDPHHPFDAPDPWSRMHHPDEVDLPKHRVRDFHRRPWWHKAAVEEKPSGSDWTVKTRANYSRIPAQSDRELRQIIANYYGMISLIDHNVGRILSVLDEQGLSDNTIVVFSSDHGDWLGDHGLVLKGPMHYEGLLRVGLIMRGPGIPSAKRVSAPVSTLDLPPTFLDYAGSSPLLNPHGQTLRPLLERENENRDFAFNEWELMPSRVGVRLSLRTVRTERYKLTLDEGSLDGEMYDLVDDPYEMDNLFADESRRKIRKELVDMIKSRPDDAKEELGRVVGFA